MKQLILLMLLLTVGVSNASIENGSIGVYTDQAGTNCSFRDMAGGYVYVYLIHKNTTGSTGSKFKLIRPAGWTYQFGSRDQTFLQTGFPDALDGVSYEYQTCQVGSFWLETLIYTSDGSTPTCSNTLRIIESPSAASGWIEGTDCSGNAVRLHTYLAVVNSDGSCFCGWERIWAPVESSTWGQIKALYR